MTGNKSFEDLYLKCTSLRPFYNTEFDSKIFFFIQITSNLKEYIWFECGENFEK